MKKLILLLCFVLSLSTVVGCCLSINSPDHPRYAYKDHLNNATVALVSQDIAGNYHLHCAAVWISEDHLVTARHCIEDENNEASLGTIVRYVTYENYDKNVPPKQPKEVYTAIVVAATSDGKDAAVLKSIDDVAHDVATFSKAPLQSGTPVHIVGHPFRLSWSYINGVISQERKFDIPEWGLKTKTLHITALIWRGNSGGAAFDDNGNIVGIASFFQPDVPGMAFFVHRDEVLKLLEDNKIKYLLI